MLAVPWFYRTISASVFSLRAYGSVLPLVFLLLFLSYCFSSSHVHAEDTIEDDTYYESFILLRVGKSRGDSFYRVIMDEEETPYLELDDILGHWLEFEVDCSPERMYCQAIMFPSERIYWIDGQEMQLGDSDVESKNKPLGQNQLIFREGKLWLRYDIFEKWLPLYSVWSLKYYSVALQLYFLTIEQRKEERVANRIRERKKREQAKRLRAIPPETPANDPTVETRYQFGLGKSSTEDGQNFIALSDLGADLYKGHFLLSAQAQQSENGSDADIGFWRYQKLHGKRYYLLDVGHTSSNSDLLLGPLDLKNGIRIDQIKKEKGAGTFDYTGHTIADSEVDIYHNGFLIVSGVADESGRYRIPSTFASGGDIFTIKLYHPDGSESVETIRIAPDSARILPVGQWDHQLVLGQLNDESGNNHGLFSSRYGINDHFTMGTHLVSLPYNLDDSFTALKLDFAWRALQGVNVLTETYSHPEGMDWSAQIDIVAIGEHNFQVNFINFADFSPLLQVPGNSNNKRQQYSLIHSYQLGRWRTLAILEVSNDSSGVTWNVDRRVSRFMNLSFETLYKQVDEGEKLVGFSIANTTDFSDTMSLNLRASANEDNYQASGLFRKQASENKKIDYNLGFTVSKLDDPFYSLGATWHISKHILASLSVLKDEFIFNFSWRGAWASNLDQKIWDDFALGSITGRVMSPPDEDGNISPLSDVVIWAESKKAITDANGEYRITDLPPHQKIQLKIDPNSLDATIAPKEPSRMVLLRPGTAYDFSPEITWTAGLDGVVFNRQKLLPDAKIQIRDGEQNTIQVIFIEADGFFLAEGLTPGKYSLHIVDGGMDVTPLEIEVPENTDWIPALELHVD